MTLKEANHRLALVGSENRAAVLVDVLRSTPSKVSKRKLAAEWFNVCEAIAPWVEDLRDEFEGIGFITDAKKSEIPDLPVTVYRAAYADDDIENALSWTTSKETAEFFARHHTSLRARFLGLYRDDAEMRIFEGTATEAYGYLTGRGEAEVIAKTVEGIEAIAALRKVEAA